MRQLGGFRYSAVVGLGFFWELVSRRKSAPGLLALYLIRDISGSKSTLVQHRCTKTGYISLSLSAGIASESYSNLTLREQDNQATPDVSRRLEPCLMSTETNAPTLDSLRRKRQEIARAARRHRASNVRVFGSVAREEAGPGSDYDFVVDLDAALGGLAAFDHLDRLERELRELLGHPVHVVTAQHDSAFARRVRRDAQPIRARFFSDVTDCGLQGLLVDWAWLPLPCQLPQLAEQSVHVPGVEIVETAAQPSAPLLLMNREGEFWRARPDLPWRARCRRPRSRPGSSPGPGSRSNRPASRPRLQETVERRQSGKGLVEPKSAASFRLMPATKRREIAEREVGSSFPTGSSPAW